MKPIKYELACCKINGEELHFAGLKIDTKQDVKRITHAGSYDAIGYVTGDRTVDFTFTDPKDQKMITRLYDLWIIDHNSFFMLMLSKNLDTGAWDPIASLENCVLTKVDHNLKSKDEWKPSVSGMALKYKRGHHQFDPETGLFNAIEGSVGGAQDLLYKAQSKIATVGAAGRALGVL
jgi:hypothetical protein